MHVCAHEVLVWLSHGLLRTSKCDSLKFSKDSYCTVDMQCLFLSKLLIKQHQFVLFGDLIDPSCGVLVLCVLHKDILISTAGSAVIHLRLFLIQLKCSEGPSETPWLSGSISAHRVLWTAA